MTKPIDSLKTITRYIEAKKPKTLPRPNTCST